MCAVFLRCQARDKKRAGGMCPAAATRCRPRPAPPSAPPLPPRPPAHLREVLAAEEAPPGTERAWVDSDEHMVAAAAVGGWVLGGGGASVVGAVVGEVGMEQAAQTAAMA